MDGGFQYRDMTGHRYLCRDCIYGDAWYGDVCPCYECNEQHCGYIKREDVDGTSDIRDRRNAT